MLKKSKKGLQKRKGYDTIMAQMPKSKKACMQKKIAKGGNCHDRQYEKLFGGSITG